MEIGAIRAVSSAAGSPKETGVGAGAEEPATTSSKGRGGRGDRAEESLGSSGWPQGGDDRLRGGRASRATRPFVRESHGPWWRADGGRDDDRAARVGQGTQEGFELGARRRAARRGLR